MDKRLQALLDKQDITELIHSYCNAADRHDHDKMRALYHEDAIDDHGAFFRAWPWSSSTPCRPSRHR